MRIYLVIVSWLLMIVASASASYISLNTALSSAVEGKTLKIGVSVVNKGDESAYNVQAEIRIGGETYFAEKKSELPVSGVYQAEKSFTLSAGRPGSFPLTLIMHYTDANQYPFSALTVRTYSVGKEVSSPLFGQLHSASFSKEGKLKLSLKNSGDAEVKTRTAIIAPRELTAGGGPLETVLPPRSERSIEFDVKNFSALAGSTYQVFALSESEDKDFHYTVVSPAAVRIVAAHELFGVSYTLIALVLLPLVIIFAAAQFIKR